MVNAMWFSIHFYQYVLISVNKDFFNVGGLARFNCRTSLKKYGFSDDSGMFEYKIDLFPSEEVFSSHTLDFFGLIYIVIKSMKRDPIIIYNIHIIAVILCNLRAFAHFFCTI